MMGAPWGAEALADTTRRRTYAELCRPNPAKPRAPAYMFLSETTRHQVRQVARFRLGSHFLRVETGRWDGLDRELRRCMRCGEEWCAGREHWAGTLGAEGWPIDDETHVLFDWTVIELEGL